MEEVGHKGRDNVGLIWNSRKWIVMSSYRKQISGCVGGWGRTD